MIISSQQLNFIHVPKAAGSSIGKGLRETFKLTKKDLEIQTDYKTFSKLRGFEFPNHSPASVKKEYIGADNYAKYFSFTFVRNPYSLLVSLYEYTHQTEKKIFEDRGWALNKFQQNILDNSFEEWVHKYPTGRCQTDLIFSDDGALLVDFIGKTENFENDVNKLSKITGIGVDTKTIANSTTHNHYREYYSESTKKIVLQRYGKAINLFDYKY